MATRGLNPLRCRPASVLKSSISRHLRRKGLLPRTTIRAVSVAAHASQPGLTEDHNMRLISMGYTFNYIENVENLEQYRYGGFHPVSLGETLNNRYLILNKLGFGGYSTVWLAWDILRQKYSALKIALADFGEDLTEVEILQRLAATTTTETHPGKDLVRHVTDCFHFDGPNGRHTCMATAPAMMTLLHAKDASYTRLFQIRTARAIVAQVVQAVDYLHQHGVVHGDLHLGNVLFQLPRRIQSLSPDQLHEQHSPPETVPVTRLDGAPLDEGAPHHAVLPIWLGQTSEAVCPADSKILLGDFGESYIPSSEKRQHSNTPVRYRPPESHFPDVNPPLSFSSDMWSLGCLIWGAMGQRPLFDPWTVTEEEVLNDQVDLLGRLPPGWSSQVRSRAEYWVEDECLEAAPARPWDHKRWTWEDRLERCIQGARRENGMEGFSEDEKEAFLEMIKTMVVFRPEGRASTKDVLESRWMKNWALPELRKAVRT